MKRPRRFPSSLATLLLLGAGLAAVAAADPSVGTDWPRFRGPQQNGVSLEKGLLRSWPESGPKVLWKKPIGSGFSFLELARFDRTLDLPDPVDRWTYYSDFRAVEGLVIAHRQDQEYGIRHVSLTVEKVQVNPEIDPARFKLK
jgi:hypothetical protein